MSSRESETNWPYKTDGRQDRSDCTYVFRLWWFGKAGCSNEETVGGRLAMFDLRVAGTQHSVMEQSKQVSVVDRLQLKVVVVGPRGNSYWYFVLVKVLDQLLSSCGKKRNKHKNI
jgi:hypothetical protein